jgi:hypothetical protein
MIREVIVSTVDRAGQPHLAPMGVHEMEGGMLAILPFRPSATLDNLMQTRCAVVNGTDDVRLFAGCLTGRRDWPLVSATRVPCMRLAECLAHTEVELVSVEEDDIRPRLLCRAVHSEQHAPFQGFNRAQFAVLEAAILVSRLHILPWAKIETELEYLRVIHAKTAGEREKEAWEWLMQAVANFRQGAKT